MKKDVIYDTLFNYIKELTDESGCYVKVYSDNTVIVSGYINGELITLEGNHSLVWKALQGLKINKSGDKKEEWLII